jgi:hypothetical protein
MHSFENSQERQHDIFVAGVLRLFALRRLIGEVVIVMLMAVVLLVDVGIDHTPGSHTLADFVTGGLFFGLVALWVAINGAILATSGTNAWTEHRLNSATVVTREKNGTARDTFTYRGDPRNN